MSELAKVLRDGRAKSGLSLRQVEARTAVPNAHLSMVGTGRIEKPSPDVLWRLAELYGLPKRWVMECGGHLASPVVQAALGYEHLGGRDRYADFIAPTQPQLSNEDRERLFAIEVALTALRRPDDAAFLRKLASQPVDDLPEPEFETIPGQRPILPQQHGEVEEDADRG